MNEQAKTVTDGDRVEGPLKECAFLAFQVDFQLPISLNVFIYSTNYLYSRHTLNLDIKAHPSRQNSPQNYL